MKREDVQAVEGRRVNRVCNRELAFASKGAAEASFDAGRPFGNSYYGVGRCAVQPVDITEDSQDGRQALPVQ